MNNPLLNIKKIHLVGIGGVGMTGLAFLLKERGLEVTGSDLSDSYNMNSLRKASFDIYIGHSADNVTEAELLCVSSAIKEDNPEIVKARELKIPIIKRGELLALLSRNIKTIAIAGSHGKTTTSALAAFVLTKLGLNPHVFIGGVSLNFDKYAWTGRDIFVIETDESDGTFLHYEPWISIITNIDHEHLDFYKDFDNLKESFSQFAKKTKTISIGCIDDDCTKDVLSTVNHLGYGFSPQSFIRAESIRVLDMHSIFDLYLDDRKFENVELGVLGKHNILNAMAVIGLCWQLNLDIEKALSCLKDFKGVRRRFEKKGQVKEVSFFDDYAHHPKEIEAALLAARSATKGRLISIFQPHRFSRVKSLWEEFSLCFGLCDYLIVTDIYAANELPIEGITALDLLEKIKENFKQPAIYIPKEKLTEQVPKILVSGDLVVGLGAGDINLLIDKIMNKYELSNKGFSVCHESH